MEIQFVTGIAVITPDAAASRALYLDAMGLPLIAEADGYLHSERIEGCKSFGVWPLTQAAQACFGTPDWPAERPVPQASVEFEVADADAVQVGADELTRQGLWSWAHRVGVSARIRWSRRRTCSRARWKVNLPRSACPSLRG